MTKSIKALLIGAAFTGLIAGTSVNMLASTYSNSKSPVNADESKDKKSKRDKHACKGKNSCKGKGGCKAGDAGCKAKNSCKGKGGCATDGSKPPTA
jgi:hypothetical protein